MERDGGRIFWPVATGSWMGALVGLEIAYSAQVLYWWGLVIGIMIGGMSAYLLGKWRQMLHAIPEAYRRVRGHRLSKEALKFQVLIWTLRFSRATMVALGLGIIPSVAAMASGLDHAVSARWFFLS